MIKVVVTTATVFTTAKKLYWKKIDLLVFK